MKLDHGLRIQGALRILPATAVVAGPSAAWLYGQRFASATEPVHMLTVRSQWFGPIQQVRVHTSDEPISPADIGVLGDFAATSVLRTAWDIGCWFPMKQSVPYLDAMLADRQFNRTELTDSAEGRRRVRGCRRAKIAFNLADPRSESFAESSLRAQLFEAGIPIADPQYVITIDGDFVARVDLAWPEHRVALEYEGVYHASPDQMPADRRRLSRIAAAGWQVVFATGRHVYGNAFPELLQTLNRALGQRGAKTVKVPRLHP